MDFEKLFFIYLAVFLCYNINMERKKVNLDDNDTQIVDASQLDKRPWLMDALLYIGNCLASITHIREKQQYLLADLENGEIEEIDIAKIVEEINNLNTLHDEVYAGYNSIMTFIMENIPNAKKEYRCLLKHTSTMLVMAMELSDAIDDGAIDETNKSTFNAFAGAVSLALGIEFKNCIRCIYDGIKQASEIK